AAGDDDVQASLDAGFDQPQHGLSHRLLLDQVRGHELVGTEAANRQQRPIHSERRNDGVDARAVEQAGVDHRRRLVNAATDLRDDLVDDAQQVAVVFEGNGRQFQLAASLDVNLVVTVDQDVGDGRVVKQRFQRAETEYFVEHFANDLVALDGAE